MPLYLIYLQVPPSAYTVFRLHIKIITFQLSFPFLFPYPFHFSLQQTKYIDLFTKRLYFFSEAIFGVIKLFEIHIYCAKYFSLWSEMGTNVFIRILANWVEFSWGRKWSSGEAASGVLLMQWKVEFSCRREGSWNT